MHRVVDDTGRHDAPGGRGASRRLLLSAFAVLLGTLPCLTLPWYYVRELDGIAAGANGPLLPLVLGSAAVLVLAGPCLRPDRFPRARHVMFVCLAAAPICGAAAARCLQEAGRHTALHEPLGPAAWLGLVGLVGGGTLALLAASALYQPARLGRRQRTELARAQQRIDAALPGWPDR